MLGDYLAAPSVRGRVLDDSGLVDYCVVGCVPVLLGYALTQGTGLQAERLYLSRVLVVDSLGSLTVTLSLWKLANR